MAQYLLFLLLLSLSSVDSSVDTNFHSYASCTSICHCSEDEKGKVLVKCKFVGGNETEKALHLPPDVYSL